MQPRVLLFCLQDYTDSHYFKVNESIQTKSHLFNMNYNITSPSTHTSSRLSFLQLF